MMWCKAPWIYIRIPICSNGISLLHTFVFLFDYLYLQLNSGKLRPSSMKSGSQLIPSTWVKGQLMSFQAPPSRQGYQIHIRIISRLPQFKAKIMPSMLEYLLITDLVMWPTLESKIDVEQGIKISSLKITLLKKKSNLKISIAYGKNYKSKAKRRLYTKLALDFLSDICHLTSCSLAAVKEKLVDIFIKGSALKNLSPSIKDFYRLLKEGST